MNDLPFMIFTQIWQTSLFMLTFGFWARWIMPMRPRLAQGILVVLIVKSIIPPIVPGPFARWTTPNLLLSHGIAGQQDSPTLSLASEKKGAIPGQEYHFNQPISGSSESLGGMPPPEKLRWNLNMWLVRLTVAIWICGAAVTGAVFWRRFRVLSNILQKGSRENSKVHKAVQSRCDEIRKSLSIRFPVRVILNDKSLGPMAMRIRQAIIVFPSCFVRESSRDEVDLALTHELLHLRRGDTFLGPFQVLAQIVWWFHPLVWWVNQLLDRCCELICDDEVVRFADCGAARYARFLVDFSQRKHLKHIFPLPAARPLSVTAQRIRSLVLRHRSPIQNNRWHLRLAWLLAAIIVIPASYSPLLSFGRPDDFASPGLPRKLMEPSVESSTPAGDSAAALVAKASAAFGNQSWQVAAGTYAEIVEHNSELPVAWFRLGYSRHMLKEFDAARTAYEQAIQFPQVRPIALYNLACLQSIDGKIDDAFVMLNESIQQGFRSDPEKLANDPDLANLRGDPRFDELVKMAASAASKRSAKYRELDFLIGEWQVSGNDGSILGHSTITKDEDGFLLTEKWRSIDGSTGTGITYFDPVANVWRQTFVGGRGNITTSQGNFIQGVLELSGESVIPNGNKLQSRSRTEPLKVGKFRFVLEETRGIGGTWVRRFDGTYNRASDDHFATES